MDTHFRSLMKALTWRVIATPVTFLVAWGILGEVTHAVQIGLLDTLIKLGAYYGHERAWDRIAIGRQKEPEYYL